MPPAQDQEPAASIVCDLASAYAHHQDQRTKVQSLEWAATGYAATWFFERYLVHKRHHELKESGADFPPLSILMKGLWAGEHTLSVAARDAILEVINAATEPLMTQASLTVFHLNCALDGQPRTCDPADCKVHYSPLLGVTVHAPDGTIYESPASPTISEFGYLTARPDGPDGERTGSSGDSDVDADESTPPIRQSRKRTKPHPSPPTAQRRLLDASPPPAGARSSNRLAGLRAHRGGGNVHA